MEISKYSTPGYILAALLGAAVGGFSVALFTEAIPKMMSRMMSTMMENMVSQMGEEGCDPEEM